MFAHFRVALFPALCGLALACSTGSARAAGTYIYTLTDLGGTSSQGMGLNDAGQVVGSNFPLPNREAFLYEDGSMSFLGTLGGAESTAAGINSAGQIVGSSQIKDSKLFHAFVYENGEMIDLGTFGGKESQAIGINSAGQVVGSAQYAMNTSRYHAFVAAYDEGEKIWKKTDLGTLGGNSSQAAAINESGQIVGIARNENQVYRAFLYENDAMRDLGTLGGAASSATGINNLGQVTGSSQFEGGNSNNHAFLYDGTSMKDLGTLGGDQSAALGINDAGQVVGFSQTADNLALHAFLYTGGSMINLNDLIDPDLGWTLTYAAAINVHGQIVGYGFNDQGEVRGFLLNPVPEPSSVALMALGLAGLAGAAYRRGRTAR